MKRGKYSHYSGSTTTTLVEPTVKNIEPSNMQKFERKVEAFKLYCWHELPEYLQFNPYITTGYRGSLTWSGCIKSLFKVHTETGNIWSHLLGVALFFYFTVQAITGSLWNQPFWGRVTFLIFLATAQYAMGTSTLYHLFMCHSEKTLWKFLRLDYSGIAALIVGSYFSPIFYSYYCYPFWQQLYLVCMSVVGFSLVILSLFEFFHSNRFHTARVLLYLITAGFGIIPALHIRYLQTHYMIAPPELAEGIQTIHYRIYLMYLSYGMGVFVYSYQFPERQFPGKFNYWFNSHQLWHLFVLLGTFLHYGTTLLIFENWQQTVPNGECIYHL